MAQATPWLVRTKQSCEARALGEPRLLRPISRGHLLSLLGAHPLDEDLAVRGRHLHALVPDPGDLAGLDAPRLGDLHAVEDGDLGAPPGGPGARRGVAATDQVPVLVDVRGGGGGGGGEGVGGNGEVDVDGEDKFPRQRSRIVRGQKQVNMPSVLREVRTQISVLFTRHDILCSKQTYKVLFSVCLSLLFPSPSLPLFPLFLPIPYSSSIFHLHFPPPSPPSHPLPLPPPQVKARDQNAQVSGYLMVHTSKTRRWKRKWFVVYDLVLYEFERHEVQ